MKYIIFLLFIQKCVSFDLPKSACKTDLTIDKDHYNVTKTYNVDDAYPTDAHYDTYGNLFFVEYGRNLNGYFFNIKVIKDNTTEAQNIPGLPDGESYSIAIDKKDTKVYFGTSKGIFVYKYESNEATLVSSPDFKLNMLFIDKDGNKYITDSPNDTEELYLLAGGKKIRYRTFEALNEMAIDDKNNFYYIKEDKLFVLKSNISKAIFIGNVSYEGLAQISFYEEIIYVASETLSYIHENDSGPLKLVKNIPGKVTAIAFDSYGNFILGTFGKIFKYEANNNECYHRKS
ncbi:uncharacterized protein LOC124530034 [Vanessa cardui]|uniref:uncharacterized protein LOC124530034 n=1 Tax=Vanessa cardui TaxID=171605 RepID=UPI001F12C8B6|nr:uncharacterized protein LOC124530034 [Vanessa cardui]